MAWLHKENPLSEEEFKEMFPKWPDGVDYSSGYDWAKFEYDGPPIDWPGLNQMELVKAEDWFVRNK